MKKIIMVLLICLLSIVTLFVITPYLIPVGLKYEMESNPFSESHTEVIDEVTFHYRKWEPTEIVGKVLFIHGLGGSTFSFRHNIPALLDAGYLVIAVDLPGFGYSDRSKGLDHSQYNRSKLLWSLLDEIDETNDQFQEHQWHLIGHSMGGGTVAAMSIERSEKTASLTIIDGAVFDMEEDASQKLFTYFPFSRWFLVFYRFGVNEKQISKLLASAYGRPLDDEEIQGYLKPLKIKGTSRSFLDMTKTSKNEDISEINNFNFPVLLIWGEFDTWVSVDQGERINNIITRSQLIKIPLAHHNPMETHYEEVNEHLLTFIEEITQE